MLSKTQEKLIKSLHTKKGRLKNRRCLVEGKKNIEMAKNFIDFEFSDQDSKNFNKLVTTQTPQEAAAVAKIPKFSEQEIQKAQTIVVLDNVQDPGNVGSILRLCLGFNASLVLIDSADVTNPKVIRSSAGAVFQTPWIEISRKNFEHKMCSNTRKIYRLESGNTNSKTPQAVSKKEKIMIIVGSEGQGISLKTKGQTITIPHNPKLESLNVTHALAILCYQISQKPAKSPMVKQK